MTVTLKEIAERIGVAPSTVSKAINNRPGVSDHLRKQILEEIEALGLRPKRQAGGLQRRTTGNLALLVRKSKSVHTDPFYSLITEGIATEVQNRGLHVIYFLLEDDETVDPELYELIEGQKADGLILIGADFSDSLLDRISKAETPIVLVDDLRPGINSVATENVDGAKQAVKHLVDYGHKNILFLSGPLHHTSIAERLEGYKQGLKEYTEGIKPNVIQCAGLAVDNGYNTLQNIDYDQSFTAVFAANDKLAIGALKALKEKGLVVPDDVSVVGFDDIEWALHTEPPLTTVRVAKRQTGIYAAKLMLQIIKDSSQHPVHIKVSTKLVIRESTRQLLPRW